MTPDPTTEHLANELRALREDHERLRDQIIRRRRLAARIVVAFAGVIAFAAVGVRVAWAAGGACPNDFPRCFLANSPAVASDLNLDLTTLEDWIVQKVGPVGSSNVAIGGTLTVTGASSMQSTSTGALTVNGTETVNGNVNVSGATSLQSTSTGALNVSGTETVTGGLTVNGVGGNVPHSCVVRSTSNAYQASCQANEVVVGGGGYCSSLWRLVESAPWAGPADGDGPALNGTQPHVWHAACQIWGNAGNYAPPQGGTYAICCQR